MVRATVKQWSDDEGWGVLTAADVPEDIWAHFSAVEGGGFRSLTAGDEVSAEVIYLGGPIQDGFRYRAERIVQQ